MNLGEFDRKHISPVKGAITAAVHAAAISGESPADSSPNTSTPSRGTSAPSNGPEPGMLSIPIKVSPAVAAPVALRVSPSKLRADRR